METGRTHPPKSVVTREVFTVLSHYARGQRLPPEKYSKIRLYALESVQISLRGYGL